MSQPKKFARFAPMLLSLVTAIGLLVWLRSLKDGSPKEVPFQISGGSMADKYLGEHFQIACDDCGFTFASDATQPPRDNLVVCPNCGFEKNELTTEHLRAGERFFLEPISALKRDLQRWDVIGCESPDDKKKRVIKRIVGLPGERVSIREGDVFVDEVRIRKSLEELRELGILVYDDRFRPSDVPSRWSTKDRKSWKVDKEMISYITPATNDVENPSYRLIYNHWPCMPSLQSRTDEMPIKDNYGYNQTVTRKLHAVDDLLIECELKLSPKATCILELHIQAGNIFVWIEQDSNNVELEFNDRTIVSAPLPKNITKGAKIEFAYCDGQVLFAIDRQVVFRENIEHQIRNRKFASSSPFSILAASKPSAVAVEVSELKIYRDIHYLDALGLEREVHLNNGNPLRKGEYLVVGDNVPISEDSRHWANPVVHQRSILGKVRPLSPTD